MMIVRSGGWNCNVSYGVAANGVVVVWCFDEYVSGRLSCLLCVMDCYGLEMM